MVAHAASRFDGIPALPVRTMEQIPDLCFVNAFDQLNADADLSDRHAGFLLQNEPESQSVLFVAQFALDEPTPRHRLANRAADRGA